VKRNHKRNHSAFKRNHGQSLTGFSPEMADSAPAAGHLDPETARNGTPGAVASPVATTPRSA